MSAPREKIITVWYFPCVQVEALLQGVDGAAAAAAFFEALEASEVEAVDALLLLGECSIQPPPPLSPMSPPAAADDNAVDGMCAAPMPVSMKSLAPVRHALTRS